MAARATTSAPRGPTTADPPATAPHGSFARKITPVAHLQRAQGNRAAGRWLQAKLAVAPTNDPLEREADEIASEVLTEPVTLHRSAVSAAGASAMAIQAPGSVDRALNTPGQPLDTRVRAFMEPRFGRDFSGVQVHTDAAAAESARDVGAHAYAAGNHLVFAGGQYAPDGDTGRRLIAHELAHVVQQDAPATTDAIVRREAEAPPGAVSTPVVPASFPEDPADLVCRPGPVPAPTEIPPGGEAVGKVGIVNRDVEPAVRLRATPTTDEDNIVASLPFSSHVQVIKRFTGDWLFVATADGLLGYVAETYIWTTLPEPNARLHRVEAGTSGTAIAIAEKYYGPYADNWGQDLRFYVNVLAWANKIPVPDFTDGWRFVHFDARQLVWIPSYAFARTLKGVVNSGSLSYNIADALGVAGLIERIGELLEDYGTAFRLSGKYLPEAIQRHVEQALWNVVTALLTMLAVGAGVLLIASLIGLLVGGPGGAAIGFKIGMLILEWLGLGMLIVWIGQALWDTASAFGRFVSMVWNARGDQQKLEEAAFQFAEAIATMFGYLIEALVLFAVSKGMGAAFGALRGTRLGRAMGDTAALKWFDRRIQEFRTGEPIGKGRGEPYLNKEGKPTTLNYRPREVLGRFYNSVPAVDEQGIDLVELDGVDLSSRVLIENKRSLGIGKTNPRTGVPQDTPASWARRHIFDATIKRMAALARAKGTRTTPGGPQDLPSITEIQRIRKIRFVLDADTPALRAAVHAEIANLRGAGGLSGWEFSVEFGVTIPARPIPGLDRDNREPPVTTVNE